MSFRLRVVADRDPLAARIFVPIPSIPFVLGREEGVDCVMADDPKVSRRHCQFEIGPGGAAVRDLGSTNGLRVNDVAYGGRKGKRDADGAVPPVALKPGDRIRVGGSTLLWEEVVDALDTAPEEVSSRVTSGSGSSDQSCAGCGVPVRASSVVIVGNRVLCFSCRMDANPSLPDVEPKPSPPPAPEAAGRAWPSIPGYAIDALLGEGGVGRVYHAHRLDDGSEAAVKVLSVDQTMDLLSFKREIEIIRSLRHENIVAFLDSGQTGDTFYLVMEFMAGGTLHQLIRRRKAVPADEALPLIRHMLAGLAAAHARGVVHRDIKPLNVMLDEPKKLAKLTDFGLAKSFLAAGLSGFTKTGTALGSINYLPPEQLHDYKRVTPAADIFGLGSVCYELLAGQSPYTVRDGDLLSAVLNHSLTPLAKRCPKLPAGVARLIDRALEKEPSARFADAGEMLAAFDQI